MEGGVSWGDVAGMAGVVLYIGSYFALQAGLVKGQGYLYAILNTLAAICVLLSLIDAFNLSSAIIQIVWIVIGVFGMVRFYVLTNRVRFTDEELVFLEVIVPGLEKLDARRLLDLGRWKTAVPGVELTEQGEGPSHVHFFLAGSADVRVHGRRVGKVGPTSLVGEIAFLSHGAATATVKVTRPSRVFSIEATALRKHLDANPQVKHQVEARLGSQLGVKLADTNTTLAAIQD